MTTAKSSDSDCQVSQEVKEAPGGKYRATKIEKMCDWGFGQGADTVSVKVEKLGADGWFFDLPLEYNGAGADQGVPSPSITWDSPTVLNIKIVSNEVSGTLTKHVNEFSVVRHYLDNTKK